MGTTKIKRNNEGMGRKRVNEGINRREDTLIKKAYELGEFDGVDVALTICKRGRYTTYRSRDHKAWPPSMAEIDTSYPLPKKILPKDVEKRLSKLGRKIKAIQKNKEDGRIMKRQTTCKWTDN